MVTAMVSPRARAKPRKIEPRMPSLAYGTTICQVVSHLVAPKARAASLWSRGTARRDSRETDMMNGIVMIARTRPAGRKPTPYAGPWKNGRNPRVCFRNGSIYRRISGTSVKIDRKRDEPDNHQEHQG